MAVSPLLGCRHPFPFSSRLPTALASLQWPFNNGLQPFISEFSTRPYTTTRILAMRGLLQVQGKKNVVIHKVLG